MSENDIPHEFRPLCYVAGPYSLPDPVENSHRAILAAERLCASGVITPLIPHLSLMWHMVNPHDVNWWYDVDIAYLARCDMLLRMPGKSSGADDEVAYAYAASIPVFFDEADAIDWAQDEMKRWTTPETDHE